MKKLDISALNDIASETGASLFKGFMDGYYASNGYFSFSVSKKEMSLKDGVYNKLQTFVDERLLEVASRIATKKKMEDERDAKLAKLDNIKTEIGN